MKNTLRITNVGEVREAKDGRKFFPVTFSAGFGLKLHTINLWQVYLRNSKNEPILDENGSPRVKWERGTPEQAKEAMRNGEQIDGYVATEKVVPYLIREGADPVSSYTTIIFGDQTKEAVFAAAGHPIVTEDGEILGARTKAVLASEKSATKSADVEF